MERFDVIAHDEQSNNRTDRFLCMCCGAVSPIAERGVVIVPQQQWRIGVPRELGLCSDCYSLDLHHILEEIKLREASQKSVPVKMQGSLRNRYYEGMAMPEPQVGMGATKLSYTDRSPYTVIEVLSKSKIVVQADEYERADHNGLSESQSYRFSENPDGNCHVLRRNRYGQWKVLAGETYFLIGRRMAYRDPSF